MLVLCACSIMTLVFEREIQNSRINRFQLLQSLIWQEGSDQEVYETIWCLACRTVILQVICNVWYSLLLLCILDYTNLIVVCAWVRAGGNGNPFNQSKKLLFIWRAVVGMRHQRVFRSQCYAQILYRGWRFYSWRLLLGALASEAATQVTSFLASWLTWSVRMCMDKNCHGHVRVYMVLWPRCDHAIIIFYDFFKDVYKFVLKYWCL